MERLQVRKPEKKDGLTEVLPERLDKGRTYLIESYYYTTIDAEQFKGIFLGNTEIDASGTTLLKSSFTVYQFPPDLHESFRMGGTYTTTQDFISDRTRYYLATADKITLAKVLEAKTNGVVGKDLAEDFYERGPNIGDIKRPYKGDARGKYKAGTKRKTKRTKRAKKGTKTKRTKRAKKGTKTKTKRTT